MNDLTTTHLLKRAIEMNARHEEGENTNVTAQFIVGEILAELLRRTGEA